MFKFALNRSLLFVLTLLFLALGLPIYFSSQQFISRSIHRPHMRLKHGTALNWSGFAVLTDLVHPANNAATDVKGKWIIPTLSCNATDSYSASWLGIDGYADNSVEQIGTEQDCFRSKPFYYTWFEMYPKASRFINLAVKPGDVISAEVSYQGNSRFLLSLKNETTGASYSTVQRANVHRQSAEWIVEAPSSFSGAVLPLSNFGTEQFSSASATLNGHTGVINDSHWQNDKINMETDSGILKAQTSDLSSSGDSFSINWAHF